MENTLHTLGHHERLEINNLPKTVVFERVLKEDIIKGYLSKDPILQNSIFILLSRTNNYGELADRNILISRINDFKEVIKNKLELITNYPGIGKYNNEDKYKENLQALYLKLLDEPPVITTEDLIQHAGKRKTRRSRKGKKSKSKQNIRRKSIRRRRR